MKASSLFRIASATAMLLILLASLSGAQEQVPRLEYADPIAGFSMTIPEDWEVMWGDLGQVMISIDAGVGVPTAAVYPVIWFWRAKKPAEELARWLAEVLTKLDAATPKVTGAGDEWVVELTAAGSRGPLWERWVVRSQDGQSYLVGALCKPQYLESFQEDLDTALATCRLIPRVPLQRFLEPTENAYRMVFPEGWEWDGRIIRAEGVPGYFEWKAQSGDKSRGAFSAPPAVLNIMTPYLPAAQAARDLVLPALQQQYGDVKLEAVHELPRVGAYFAGVIKAVGIGNNPHVDKVRADYLVTMDGTRVRARLSIGTFMLEASPLLGGRGDWFLTTNGAWAPVATFDRDYPIGRGVIPSIMTDEEWRSNQFEATNEVALWRAWNRELQHWNFMLYLWGPFD